MNILAEMENVTALAEKRDPQAADAIRRGLVSPAWEVRYAAAAAAEILADPALIPDLTAVLKSESGKPLYTRRENPPENDEIRAAWECRGRVKQAVYYALRALGGANVPAFEMMAESALSTVEDSGVRVSACAALTAGRAPGALAVLKKACNDPEFCTAKEAARGCRTLA